MLTAALFTIVKIWKPSVNRLMDKGVVRDIDIKYYSAMRKKEMPLVATI